MVAQLRALEFAPDELALAQQMLEAARALQEIEKLAFAATQGLYDRGTQQFVDEGRPDIEHAIELVHSPRYEAARATLERHVQALSRRVAERTMAERDRARVALERAVNLALLANLLLLPVGAAAVLGLRRRVLQPIAELADTARALAAGRYGERTRPNRAQVTEIAALATTLDRMAQAIEEELVRRDEVQRELAAAREQAEAAARVKAAFLANMSHEIRTPMNAIMGMTELALYGELPPLARSYLEKGKAASAHLLQLVNDVLDFSKVEAGGLALDERDFELETLVQQSLALVRHRAHEKGLELVCEFDDPALLGHQSRLRGDALRLGQVLTNLLSNAVKFTSAGRVLLHMGTRPGAPEGQVALCLAVSDTGIGLTAQERSQLFREFSQADVSITRRYGGTGLGLAISQRLLQLMGGHIEVDSTPGAGSTFSVHVTLPLAEPAWRPAGLPLQEPPPPALRVLVVEDRDDTRAAVAALAQQLLASGGRVQTVADAASALQHLAQSPCDLVITDWVLPDRPGAELLDELRRRHPRLPLAVMSAFGSPALAAAVSSAGVPLLDKPVLPQDLRRLFNSVDGRAPVAAAAPAPGASADLRGLRVLVVEDNELNREVVQGLLQSRGVAYEVAHHGLQALELLRARAVGHFDGVLLDLQMPVMDGYETIATLRRDRRWDTLPVLAMTANASAEERERCLAAGMQGHIGKPFVPDTLFAALAQWRQRPLVLAAAPAPTDHTAPATASSPTAEAAALPTVPGLDTERLLLSCGGNRALAERLLRGLERDHGDGLQSWHQALQAGDWKTLERLAHTLQGQAGTVGAQALREQALALEQAARGGDAEAATAALATLEPTLARLLLALTAARPSGGEGPEERGVDTAEADVLAIDGHAPHQALQSLALLLADADSRAIDWWQQHGPRLAPQLEPVALRALNRALEQFDFDAALAALQRMGVATPRLP
jgi:two-component system, sensor histidine kinase and response regulator